MKEFTQLLELTDLLLGPDGCPWDREQTFQSLRKTVTEEVYELLEAIDLGDKEKILDELGDLFFNILFFCKLGEKEACFNTQAVLQNIYDKLVRRHPHVFGDTIVETVDQLYEQWDKIKSQEKVHIDRKSALDGIPLNLPSLVRAQKMLKKLKKENYTLHIEPKDQEEALGLALLSIVEKSQEQKIDAEAALRKVLTQQEQLFREKERSTKNQEKL